MKIRERDIRQPIRAKFNAELSECAKSMKGAADICTKLESVHRDHETFVRMVRKVEVELRQEDDELRKISVPSVKAWNKMKVEDRKKLADRLKNREK